MLEDLFFKMLHRTKHFHAYIQAVHNMSVLLSFIVGGSGIFEIGHQRVMGLSVVLD